MKNRFYYFLLSLLGFSTACQTGSIVDMYGTPSVKLRVQGKVTDAAGTPVKGIEVSADNEAVKVTTDEKGNYDLKDTFFPTTGLPLTFTDIDGPENGGEFEPQSLEVTFTEEDRTAPGGSWDKGSFEKSQVDIRMTKKE